MSEYRLLNVTKINDLWRVVIESPKGDLITCKLMADNELCAKERGNQLAERLTSEFLMYKSGFKGKTWNTMKLK